MGVRITGTKIAVSVIAAMLATAGLAGCAGTLAGLDGGPATVRLDENDNGHNVRVSGGQLVEVTLHSTYWTFDPLPATTVLSEIGQPTVAASPPGTTGCVPGEGCGTVTLVARAGEPGTAAVTASRLSCGEARGCSPDQQRYQVMIVVDSVATTPPSTTPLAGTPSSPSATTSEQSVPGAVLATDTDNGGTVVLTAGQRIIITLHSTYWTFDPPASAAILQQMGPVAVTASPPGVGCVPGGGCGTVSQAFLAAGTGQTRVTASRTSCGEARGCTGGQGSYQLTVVVR